MRKRFTQAFYAVSAAAVAASGLGLSTGTASADTHVKKDTVACGSLCVSLFSAQLGSQTTLNAFIKGDTGTGGKVGKKVNLHIAGNFRPNGDFEPSVSGFVFQYCGFLANDFFSPTSYVCTHYPFFDVFELNWAPFGNDPSVNYCPWINGGDTKFSQPLVMTLNTGTQKPTNQIQLQPESHVGGDVRTNQLFAFYFGPV